MHLEDRFAPFLVPQEGLRKRESNLIAGTPPTPGGVFYLAGSLNKNPEEEDPTRNIWYTLHLVHMLRGGPYCSGFLVREPAK